MREGVIAASFSDLGKSNQVAEDSETVVAEALCRQGRASNQEVRLTQKGIAFSHLAKERLQSGHAGRRICDCFLILLIFRVATRGDGSKEG